MSRTDTNVRNLPEETPEGHECIIRALNGSHPISDTDNEDPSDEFDTVPLFDEWVSELILWGSHSQHLFSRILRHEGDGDVFALRRWEPEYHSDSDSDSVDVGMSD
jgi:WD repeat-containing protein 22